jgi:predicted nucleic acid-binding protein
MIVLDTNVISEIMLAVPDALATRGMAEWNLSFSQKVLS